VRAGLAVSGDLPGKPRGRAALGDLGGLKSHRDGTQMPLVYRHNAPWGARRHAGRPSSAERY
jgi:hypothetical protein